MHQEVSWLDRTQIPPAVWRRGSPAGIARSTAAVRSGYSSPFQSRTRVGRASRYSRHARYFIGFETCPQRVEEPLELGAVEEVPLVGGVDAELLLQRVQFPRRGDVGPLLARGAVDAAAAGEEPTVRTVRPAEDVGGRDHRAAHRVVQDRVHLVLRNLQGDEDARPALALPFRDRVEPELDERRAARCTRGRCRERRSCCPAGCPARAGCRAGAVRGAADARRRRRRWPPGLRRAGPSPGSC